MRNIEPEKQEGSFESLIRAEESAALARFRAGDFEADVRKRIAGAPRVERERPFGRILARPAWIAIAAGILLIAVGLALFRRPAPKPDLARSIEDILRLAPEIDTLEAGFSAGGRAPEATAVAPEADNLAALIARSRSFGEARSSGRGESVPRKREIRPLSLEEIYRIVSVDKSIERVLMLVS
jgi:hypothetical protein